MVVLLTEVSGSSWFESQDCSWGSANLAPPKFLQRPAPQPGALLFGAPPEPPVAPRSCQPCRPAAVEAALLMAKRKTAQSSLLLLALLGNGPQCVAQHSVDSLGLGVGLLVVGRADEGPVLRVNSLRW